MFHKRLKLVEYPNHFAIYLFFNFKSYEIDYEKSIAHFKARKENDKKLMKLLDKAEYEDDN